MELHRRKVLPVIAGAVAMEFASAAKAQSYPSRPVHLIIGYPAGAAADIVGRLLGQSVSEQLGQQFVIENRSGTNSNLATEAVAHAAADGYTLLLAINSNAINATLYDKLNFNFIRDFEPLQASCAPPSSWWYIRRFLPKRFRNLLPMPRPTRTGSTWHPRVSETLLTWPANCSRQ
jgi:tripartite-type tricarboxylate transporter receptor subunit TctC